MTFKNDIVPIKLRLYGESFKINNLRLKDVDLAEFIRVAERLKEPLEASLLNVSFFRILNQKKYQSVESMIDETFGGLINTPKNKIEIWRGRKCLQKFNLNELVYPSTLFPLFNASHGQFKSNLNDRITLIEKEVGLIAEYVLICKSFDINLLRFEICNVQYANENFQLLVAIYYDSKLLESQKSDTLLTYRYCINNFKNLK